MKIFFNRVNKAMQQAKGGVRLWEAGYITVDQSGIILETRQR